MRVTWFILAPFHRLTRSVQHGRPLQVLDMGETAVDEETFDEYLQEMQNIYTADKVCGGRPRHRLANTLIVSSAWLVGWPRTWTHN